MTRVHGRIDSSIVQKVAEILNNFYGNRFPPSLCFGILTVMHHFRLPELDPRGVYSEILRVPALSLGIYRHRAGTGVVQEPHQEDEVYVVLSGSGIVSVDGEDQPVGAGSVVYVPARLPHYFHSVTDDLSILVMFAPAERIEA
ncbi:MAG: cupin domain-containing protein [Bryobacterales bacterium]|nr:cupin domain-containing protein [Bryobacterales bacterium]